tara:strand:+ start:1436 stop:2023 length:588 start_codon:yes stop_codon:yes gene_type:complete
MVKTLYCIRHGTSEHNVRYKEVGHVAFNEKMDTKLVDSGIAESINLGITWDKRDYIDLVIVSPLSRTLETCSNIFKNTNTNIIVLDDLIEYPQHAEICNKRENKSVIEELYPRFDFSQLSETREWDSSKSETYGELKQRSNNIKQWILNRPEKNICIVAHCSFLLAFMNDDITKDKIEKICQDGIKHCYPYKMEL